MQENFVFFSKSVKRQHHGLMRFRAVCRLECEERSVCVCVKGGRCVGHLHRDFEGLGGQVRCLTFIWYLYILCVGAL